MCCKLDLKITSTPHGQQENWVAFICMWCKSNLEIVSTPHGDKKLGYIHLYVVQIRPKIISAPYGSKKIGLHPLLYGVNQT
jgi:hypothetical protein